MDELDRLVAEPRETRGVELKKSMSWVAPETKEKVIRAALALSNHRDGGFLLFGFHQEADGSHSFAGMSEEDAASFEPDLVLAKINSHAAPHVLVDVVRRVIDGKRVVAVIVDQFRDVPTICAKDLVLEGKAVLKAGRIYCRSRRMAESTEIQGPDDLREILDLAVETALVRYATLRRAEAQASGPSDADQFVKQLEDLA